MFCQYVNPSLSHYMLISTNFLIALYTCLSKYLCKYFIKKTKILASPRFSNEIELIAIVGLGRGSRQTGTLAL